MGRRPKKEHPENTRVLIFNAALDLMAEKGYKGTTIRAIAKAAGIRESSVYHYYEDKEALFGEIMEYSRNELMAILPPAGKMRELLTTLSTGDFLRMGLQLFLEKTGGTAAGKFMMIVLSGQYQDPLLGAIMREYFASTVSFLETAFQALMDLGKLKKGNALTLAEEYQYSLFGFIMDYFNNVTHGQDFHGSRRRMENHIAYFVQQNRS